jgi:diguanylate cyclase (GGDEF)-like protein
MNGSRLHSYWRLSMLSTGTALLVALLLLLGYHAYSEREDLLRGLTMQARLLGANLTAAIVFEDSRTAGEIIDTAESSPIIVEAAIYRRNGSLMAHFERPGIAPQLGNVAPPVGHAFSLADLRLALPVRLESREVGVIALRASLDGLYADLLRVFGSMALILIVSAALGNVVSRRMRVQMAEAENEIERMALYDRVTGLANRHAFELGLAQALQRHTREGGGSALLFIDVDGFKKVNDRFGHQTGDTVLKAIGERLGKTLRASDIVARIGGDEFAVILTNTQAVDDAALVAENLVRTAAEPFATGDVPAHIGFSIGICMIPDDGCDVESALRNADLAMYHAKQAGKNTHRFFSEHLGAKTQRGLDIEAGLRRALTNHDLNVAYQPQRSRRSGQIEGIEALVRWRHPEHGPISPLEFIPVAEEAGLIQDIGCAVLELVCSDIADMKAAGLAVPSMAINVSARQVAQGELAADILGALSRHGLTPQAIRIELSERLFIDHGDTHVKNLDNIAAQGIGISIDDFGTGSSSLAYLKDLPISMLKIDMRFIRDLPGNAEALALVKGIVAMGHAIDLKVVAVGVESALQAECLAEVDCDLLQGYHIGLPMNRLELMQLLGPA